MSPLIEFIDAHSSSIALLGLGLMVSQAVLFLPARLWGVKTNNGDSGKR